MARLVQWAEATERTGAKCEHDVVDAEIELVTEQGGFEGSDGLGASECLPVKGLPKWLDRSQHLPSAGFFAANRRRRVRVSGLRVREKASDQP